MITNEELLQVIQTGTLVGIEPKEMLPHGPTKLLVGAFHWHSPKVGLVASYTPTELDVKDHFDVFRGVDLIEAFALSVNGCTGTFLECRKQNCIPDDLKQKYIPTFFKVGQVDFHSFVRLGETFICLGHITFNKWRQTSCDGRIYKVPENLDLDAYFSDFTEERLMAYDLREDFVLVAELFDITGRAIAKEFFK
jgi:hypothetical protein